MELGRSYRALGDIMEQKGEIEQMLREYRHSLQIFANSPEPTRRIPPSRTNWPVPTRRWPMVLAGPRTPMWRLLVNYKKSLAICEELLRQDSSSAKRKRAVAINLMKIGGASDPHQPEAIAALRKGVATLESLAAADPDNSRARREVGWGYKQLGDALMAAGDYAGALASRQKSLAIKEKSRGGRSAKCPGEFRSRHRACRSRRSPLRHRRCGARQSSRPDKVLLF